MMRFRMRATAFEPWECCDMVLEGGRIFIAVWTKDEEKAAESRRRRGEEERGMVVIASGLTAGQMRRFRIALI